MNKNNFAQNPHFVKPKPSKEAALLVHNYTKAHIIHAFTETGVFDALKNKPKGISIHEIVSQTNLYERFLKALLDYMYLNNEIISKKNNLYSLKKDSSWVFKSDLRYELLLALGAYQPIMCNLVESLRGEKVYGKDYERDGKKLATASFGVTKENYPFVVEELKRLKVKRVADLGCGAAEVLISFCKLNPDLKGVGIDIDPRALEEAQRRVNAVGFADRIELVRGDITKPQEWYPKVKNLYVDAFTCIGVLHEFLREGKHTVATIMNDLKSTFPGTYFMLGEFDALSEKEYRALSLEDKQKDLWYQHIIHPLSMQGIPISKEEWCSLFESVGIETIAVQKFFLDQFVFKL